MYNKRIAFLMSYQHLIPHGGIGQFALSFVKQMKDNNIKVDIITDKFDKHTEFTKTLQNDGARFIYPDNPLSYSKHQGIFMYGDSYCLERMINFRNSVIKALESNLYDSIVCNTYETSRLMSEIGLEDCIQIINYTHLESQLFENTKNPFLDNVNHSMRLQMQISNTTIGTQSEFNAQILGTLKGVHLPIPLPEPSLLEEHNKAPHARLLQKELAKDITIRVHSDEDYNRAIEASDLLFGKANKVSLERISEMDLLSIVEGIPGAELSKSEFAQGVGIIDVLSAKSGFLKSNGDARRALKENSISVNKEKVKEDFVISSSDIIANAYVLLQRGKKNYFLLKIA